jgi:hemolysin-activating ACP:hemolysin acyltransferase
MVNNSDIIDIIRLYRNFPKYTYLSDRDIARAIIPSLALNQFNIFRYESTGVAYAFTNWAFISPEVEKRFKEKGYLEMLEWDSGNICWHVETVNTAPNKLKEIYKWTADKLEKYIGEEGIIHWIRMNKSGRGIKRYNKMKVSTAKRKFN